jgi:hypothetical protein
MYIAKLKVGPKRAKKTFSMILERVFEMVWWRGRKSHKKDFDVEVFSPLRILTSPLFEEPLRVFLFLPLFPFSFFFFFSLFYNTFSLFFYAPSLDIWGEKSCLEKLFFNWLDME